MNPTHATGPASPTHPAHTTTATTTTNATNALGRYGEELAVRRLTESGMSVLARNWRCGRTGEIDIVARDGDTVVICEVKTRREGAFEHPMAAVTPTKADRLKQLAACWLDRHGGPPPDGGVRIDLIGIVLPRRGAPVVTHAQGVA
ncbi:YraN family protein [Streptomyces sp. NPDC003035]|uniref:YraN family protein n=1 Tax=Streptomyces sp. NPDC003035 TaxID=3364676 RepID=UPI0036B82360